MGQQNISVLALTVVATGVITKHRFVTVAGAQAGAGANALGVSQEAAGVGDALALDVLGTTVVEAGAAVAKGAALQSDANGRAVTKDAGAATARALEAAAAEGDLIEAVLIPN
jgi:hypothetical protein